MKKTTILSVMAVLWPIASKDKRSKNKGTKLSAYLLIALLYLLMGQLQAQEPIKALKVGDKLTESFWQQEHIIYANGKTTMQTLAQYKGKLLILDFWATWCGPCITAFPKLQAYQQQFKNKLAIVLVNSVNTADKDERINKTLAKFSNSTEVLACIKSDTVLLKSFPHAMVPLYVWIIDGSVRAITAKEWLSEINITEVLQAGNKLNSSSTKQAQK